MWNGKSQRLIAISVMHSKELVCSEETSSLQKQLVESKMQCILLSHGAVGHLAERPYPTRGCQLYQWVGSQVRVGPRKPMAALPRCPGASLLEIIIPALDSWTDPDQKVVEEITFLNLVYEMTLQVSVSEQLRSWQVVVNCEV